MTHIKPVILLFICSLLSIGANAQGQKTRTADNGGSGMFKSIAVKEPSLPDFVIYRPKDMLHAHARQGALPVLIWGNGGCSDTSAGYERTLIEVASHGYIVVAIGEMQDYLGQRKERHTPSTDIKRGIDWIVEQTATRGSDYYQNADTACMAAAGHSCGGAQVLANAADPRLKTYLIMNAGMGDMRMADASAESLNDVHGPILYVVGGKRDVAYANAQIDYERISHAPVALADHPASGHGGTYGQPNGGDYARIMLDWLDWHLKGEKGKARIFLNGELSDYKGWSVKAKNFKLKPSRIEEKAMPCKLLQGVAEREYSIYLPQGYDEDTLKTYPVLYLLHGGGESNTVWHRKGRLQHIADSLTNAGVIDDMIIVCPEANKNNMIYFNAPNWTYEDFFFQEFIPHIEQAYRVRTDKGGRAIAGFSMGGGAAAVYGLHKPEMFCMVYDISGYLRRQPLEWLKNDPSGEWRQQNVKDNNPIKHIERGTNQEIKAWKQVDWMVSVGDQDFTLEANMDFIKALRSKSIPCSMNVSSGGHDWRYVTPAIEDAIKRANSNFESLWIKSGNSNIYGVLSRPHTSEKKQPVAIIAHGFNGTHHFGRNYFKLFNELGYQCYTFDFPCGSVNSRSDNNTMEMSILDEQKALEDIIAHFKQQPDVDASRIVLVGESQGGLVSALTAAKCQKDVSRLVLVYPALCIPDNWNDRYPRIEDIPDTTHLWNVPMGRRFFTEVRDMDVFKQIKRFKNPVLIVQGDKDNIVSMEDSRRAVNTYKDARLHVIPGAGHGFRPNEFEVLTEQIRLFLTEEEE